MKHWSWASASCIGTSHSQSGQPLQDAHTCRMIYPAGVPGASASSLHPASTQAPGADDGNTAPWLLAIACDGAGSATHSRLGAVLTCRTLSQAVHRYFGQPYPPGLPDDATLHVWVERARQRIALAAARRGLQPRDFACTLLFALSNGRQTLVAHTGDGGIVAHHAQTQTWQTLSWPEHGEFAATTRFITDTPPEQTRIGRFDAPFDALAVFTDGIERLVLDMKTRTPHAPFFGAMTTPLLDEVPTAATHPTVAGNASAGQAAPVPGAGAPAAPVQHTAQQGPSPAQHAAPQGPSAQPPGPQAPAAQHHNPHPPLAQRPGPQAPAQYPGAQPSTQRPGMQRAYAQGPNPQGAYMQRHNGQGSYAQGPSRTGCRQTVRPPPPCTGAPSGSRQTGHPTASLGCHPAAGKGHAGCPLPDPGCRCPRDARGSTGPPGHRRHAASPGSAGTSGPGSHSTHPGSHSAHPGSARRRRHAAPRNSASPRRHSSWRHAPPGCCAGLQAHGGHGGRTRHTGHVRPCCRSSHTGRAGPVVRT